MSQEAKILTGIGVITIVLAIVGAIFLSNQSNPSTQSQPVTNANLLVKGDSNQISTPSAQLTIVEFADFECPACERAYPDIKKILSEYQGRINFVYRHFPLPQHQNAMISARAAEAAGAQGKFWEMYDLLFKNQSDWAGQSNALEIFQGYAQTIGLDMAKFNQDINNETLIQKINSDKNDGLALGVNATPTFFIGDKKYQGNPNYASLKQELDNLLK